MKKFFISLGVVFIIYFLFFFESSLEKEKREARQLEINLQKEEAEIFIKSLDPATKFFNLRRDKLSKKETSYEREKDISSFFNSEDYFLLTLSKANILDYLKDSENNFLLFASGKDALFKITCKEDFFSLIEEVRDSYYYLYVYGRIKNIYFESRTLSSEKDDKPTVFYPDINFSCERVISLDDIIFDETKQTSFNEEKTVPHKSNP